MGKVQRLYLLTGDSPLGFLGTNWESRPLGGAQETYASMGAPWTLPSFAKHGHSLSEDDFYIAQMRSGLPSRPFSATGRTSKAKSLSGSSSRANTHVQGPRGTEGVR